MLLPLAILAAPVLSGVDVLERDGFELLKGRSVALITNHTGRTLDGRSTLDVLHESSQVRLSALFAPEHGIRGALDESVADGVDEKTGLKVYSLYNLREQGEARYMPDPEQLAGCDTIVFDIQDVGARFYTYTSTMGYAMRAADQLGLRFIVLDRPNPIGGLKVEGPVAEPQFFGLTAFQAIPTRHGMTAGELALLYKEMLGLKLEVIVVKAEGWRRSMLWEETGQMWVNPSPNMRSLTQALLYPGVCLVEATDLSVGRGTDSPFEVVGAPYVDGRALAAAMNAKRLPGAAFYPVTFTPDASRHSGQACQGVRIVVTDRQALEPVRLGLELAREIHQRHPEFEDEKVVRLLQNAQAQDLGLGIGYAAALAAWTPALEDFMALRARHLLYAE
jgi:uncharacterized protein YbbC (DUF1343 family)